MEIFFPPDYKYSLTYLIIIICLSGVMLYFGHRVEKKNSIDEESKFDRFVLRLVLSLVLLGTIYFFILPNYL